MFADFLMLGGNVTLLGQSAKALVEWNPTTFYIAAAILHIPVIWVGYRLLDADPEYNTFPAAIASAAVGNVAAFFLKDFGVVGVIGAAGTFFIMLMVTSGIDIFRSIFVFILAMGMYWGVGTFVAKRTPLDAYSIGGVTKVLMTGGFQPEPLKRKDDEELLPGSSN